MTSKLLFLDTEFTCFEAPRLVSLALVHADGRHWYGVSSDFTIAECSQFVKEVVLEKLEEEAPRIAREAELAQELAAWLAPMDGPGGIETICDYPTDWHLLMRLLEGHSIKERLRGSLQDPTTSPDGAQAWSAHFEQVGWSKQHHALHDAKALALAWKAAVQGKR